MTWSATFQFTSLSKAVGGDVPEWGGVTDCTEADARFFFNMWAKTFQFKNRTLVLWDGDQVVEVKFAK
jgi:hypothetical protein